MISSKSDSSGSIPAKLDSSSPGVGSRRDSGLAARGAEPGATATSSPSGRFPAVTADGKVIRTAGRAKNSCGLKHTSRVVSQKPFHTPRVSRRSHGTAFTPRAAHERHMGMGSRESRQASQPNVPQRLQVNPAMPLTVRRFLQLARPDLGPAELANVLAEVGAHSLETTEVNRLSGGELQRVLLARALLRNPELLVLDEPAQGVDITGQEELYTLITRMRDQRGLGVLMVSHDLHLVMAATDHVLCLNQHVCCEGHPESVSAHPEDLRLFGMQGVKGLAVYSHHHDHHHDAHGGVCTHKGPHEHI